VFDATTLAQPSRDNTLKTKEKKGRERREGGNQAFSDRQAYHWRLSERMQETITELRRKKARER
jgi:hypothetical protein